MSKIVYLYEKTSLSLLLHINCNDDQNYVCQPSTTFIHHTFSMWAHYSPWDPYDLFVSFYFFLFFFYSLKIMAKESIPWINTNLYYIVYHFYFIHITRSYKAYFLHINRSYIFRGQFLLHAPMTTYLKDRIQSIGRYGGLLWQD